MARITLVRPLMMGLSALALITIIPARADEAHSTHEVHWSYEGAGSPEHWGNLKPEYNTCKLGKSQSPVNISTKTAASQNDIAFSYNGVATDIVNNGHTIQVNMAPGSTISVGGKTYTLLQFHFHSPSEHTLNGRHAPMVVHMVHKSDDGQLGVIGVMMDLGQENQVLAPLWAKMPQGEGEKVALDNMKIDLMSLLPATTTYYSYEGSLTTPPCTEGVHWMVMSNRVTVSKEQVEAFTKLFPHSTRPLQALNGRKISGG